MATPQSSVLRFRHAETKPLFEAFKPWLMDRLAEVSAKSPLSKAIRYMLGHWDGLTVFLGDGRVEVDNNTVERTLRPIALGGKTHYSLAPRAAVRVGRFWRR